MAVDSQITLTSCEQRNTADEREWERREEGNAEEKSKERDGRFGEG